MSGKAPLADHPIDADYEAIKAAVMETARGRWFLGEHARRNRHAETDRLAVLLEEIRAAVQTTKAPTTAGANIGAAFIPVLRPSQTSLAGPATLPVEPAPRQTTDPEPQTDYRNGTPVSRPASSQQR